jgi:hypothetical protein
MREIGKSINLLDKLFLSNCDSITYVNLNNTEVILKYI